MRKATLVLSAGCALVAGVIAAQVAATPEKIAFPTGFESWERYAIVDRHDSKQYRELYAKPEVVKAVRTGRPIPDGTVLVMAIFTAERDGKGDPVKDASGRFRKGKPVGVTVMQKRKGWGTVIPEEWRNGDWLYASFTPDGKPNAKANANIRNCFVCHKPHEQQDFVISLASLSGTFPTGAVKKPAGSGIVSIAEFLFGPEKITVKAGQTITWVNVDDSPHQVTVQGETVMRTPVVLKGQSTALTFEHPGTYGYICGLHPAMKGQIEVVK